MQVKVGIVVIKAVFAKLFVECPNGEVVRQPIEVKGFGQTNGKMEICNKKD